MRLVYYRKISKFRNKQNVRCIKATTQNRKQFVQYEVSGTVSRQKP
jgi:hypothetical protein